MSFEFATATRIIFGAGVLGQVGPLARAHGSHALVVGGSSSARLTALLDRLSAEGVGASTFSVAGEPTIDMIREGVRVARGAGCDSVIGIGGGSVIDAGKAIATLLTNPGDAFDYLEVIGRGQSINLPSAPYIAIPTTAGTGAEVTRNAVLGSPEQQIKVSMRSPYMLPRLALIDPELTYSLPQPITASTGLDALTQCMEPFVSLKANPLTDGLCREGMARAARSLRRAYEHGDPASREDMALASLLGGLALANAALGAVHGFAGPLGGMFSAPHGMICAALLPWVMAANLHALHARAPDSPALARYDEVARILTDDPEADAADGVVWVQDLCAALAVPPLARFGVTLADLPAVAEKAQHASSMRGNPIVLNAEELDTILHQAL